MESTKETKATFGAKPLPYMINIGDGKKGGEISKNGDGKRTQKGITAAIKSFTRWVALMIQLEKFVGGGVVGWLTPTTYIQLAGAGSKRFFCWS